MGGKGLDVDELVRRFSRTTAVVGVLVRSDDADRRHPAEAQQHREPSTSRLPGSGDDRRTTHFAPRATDSLPMNRTAHPGDTT